MTDSLSPKSSVLSPPPTGRIDVHSHLLPGIDDGCKTVDESIACARTLVTAGYSHAFCTPHIWPKYTGVSRTSVPRLCASLQTELDAAGVALKLLPGGEMNLYAGVDKIPTEDIVPLALGNYMLVDMWASEIQPFFEPTIKWIQSMGLTVILAHPERMRAVQDQPDIVDYFSSLGILLQGNLQCFSDKPEADTRRCAERFLAEDKYFLLGSDSHNPESMDIRIRGLDRAIQLAGEAKIDELTKTNPRKLAPALL
jgi:protein-tyrosine phosphatase